MKKNFLLLVLTLFIFSSFNEKPVISKTKFCPAFIWFTNNTSARVITRIDFYSKTDPNLIISYTNLNIQPGQTVSGNANGGLPADSFGIVVFLNNTNSSFIGSVKMRDYSTNNVLACNLWTFGFKKGFDFSFVCGSYILEVSDDDFC